MARLDHTGLVVDDLEAAIAFFTATGLRVQGRQRVSGPWVGRVLGLDEVTSEVVGLAFPGQEAWLELSRFDAPTDDRPADAPPANRLGLRHLCLQVDDLDQVLDALAGLGHTPLGSVEDFEGQYRLCYVRGPEGVLVELAQRL